MLSEKIFKYSKIFSSINYTFLTHLHFYKKSTMNSQKKFLTCVEEKYYFGFFPLHLNFSLGVQHFIKMPFSKPTALTHTNSLHLTFFSSPRITKELEWWWLLCVILKNPYGLFVHVSMCSSCIFKIRIIFCLWNFPMQVLLHDQLWTQSAFVLHPWICKLKLINIFFSASSMQPKYERVKYLIRTPCILGIEMKNCARFYDGLTGWQQQQQQQECIL
jgi:hypothetical protein